jgi:hypothetical protein
MDGERATVTIATARCIKYNVRKIVISQNKYKK